MVIDRRRRLDGTVVQRDGCLVFPRRRLTAQDGEVDLVHVGAHPAHKILASDDVIAVALQDRAAGLHARRSGPQREHHGLQAVSLLHSVQVSQALINGSE